MEAQGKLTSTMRSLTGNIILTFEVEGFDPEVLTGLKDQNLDITFKQHRERRSLDANAYAWVLMSKIAEHAKTSKEEVYETMLRRYGAYELDGGKPVLITLQAHIDISLLSGHWMFVRQNGNFKSFMMLKGSSEFDTKEMSTFIDGIVSECKELGIETMTPDELMKMKEVWK